jgi:glycosyltransferase involved in cell wall biosynthesis
MKKICLIYNYAQHYRKNIFMLLDKELDCDFIFGDKMGDVKKMDYSLLAHLKKEVKNKTILYPIYYQKGVLSLLKEDYTHFLFLGDLNCISTWLMLLLSHFFGKKIYFWSHGWYGKESKFRALLKKFYFNYSDGVFLYGNYAKNLMIDNGIDSNKLFVIYNSLSYDEQKIIRTRLKKTDIYKNHFHNERRNLIFIGRLTRVKKLDLLLKAFYILNEKVQKYNLIFIGSGEMTNELSEMAQSLDISKDIWFFGETYDELELSELIFNADLCVSPGNVGLTAIHAMTYGCPVITHDNFAYQGPEFEAIVSGRTGIFFKYNNIQSLIESINNWFNLKLERNLIIENCFKIIDTKYNPHYQIDIIKENIK